MNVSSCQAVLRALSGFSLRHRLASLGLIAACTLGLAAGLPQLGVDVRIEKTFPEESPQLAEYEALQAAFGGDEDTAICVVEFPQSVLERDTLQRIYEITEALREVDLVDTQGVTSLSHATWVRLDGDSDLDMGPLYEPSRYAEWDAAAMDVLLRDHPAFDQRLVSRDRRLAGFVVPMLATDTRDETRSRFVAGLRTFFSQEGVLRPGETAYLEGFAVARDSIISMMAEDSARFLPLAFVSLLLVLGLLFGELVAPALALSVIGLSVVWTLGAMAWAGIPLSTMSTTIPVMVLVASVGDVVHLLSSYRTRIVAGHAKAASLRYAVEHVAAPCLLTSLTTAAGFVSLAGSQIEMLRELGAPVAFGVLAAYVVTLGVLPPLLSWLPAPRVRASRRQAPKIGLALGRAVTQRAVPVIGGSLLVGALSVAVLPLLSHDTQIMEGFDRDAPLVVAQTVLEERFGGAASLEVVLSSDAVGRVLEPEVQRAVLRLSERIRGARFRELGVLAAHSLPDTLSDAYYTWNQRASAFKGGLPETAAGVGQLQFLLGFSEQDPTRGLVDSPDEAHRLRVRVRVSNLYSSEFFRLVDAIEEEAQRLLPEDVSVVVTGSTLMGRLVGASLVSEMLRSAGFALLLVGGLVFAFFRSVRVAALAVLCSGLPLLLTLGLMAVTGTALTVSTSVVFALAFGISIDDTIHVVAGYNQRRVAGDPQAIVNTLQETGSALLLSTVALVLGFSVLCVSNFPANRTFAYLLSATLVFALVADLVFLPALLAVFAGTSEERVRVAVLAAHVALGLLHTYPRQAPAPERTGGQSGQDAEPVSAPHGKLSQGP